MTRISLSLTLLALTVGTAVAVAAPAHDGGATDSLRAAVVAAPDASDAAIARAEAAVTQHRPIAGLVVRRTGGAAEARAAVAALAASGVSVIAGAGPSARAAVEEARVAGPPADYVDGPLRASGP